MTYEMQRYLASRKDLQRADGSMMMSGSDICVVIAADAEAALETQAQRIIGLADVQASVAAAMARDEAFLYCIDVVEDLSLCDDHGTLTAVEFKDRVIAAIHCLIERELSE